MLFRSQQAEHTHIHTHSHTHTHTLTHTPTYTLPHRKVLTKPLVVCSFPPQSKKGGGCGGVIDQTRERLEREQRTFQKEAATCLRALRDKKKKGTAEKL